MSFLALDVASSELWNNGTYVFKKSGEPSRTASQMVEMYTEVGWQVSNHLRSRTASPEGDWDGWKMLTRAIGDRVQLVGDECS
jgi:enolase